jgi:hypothetical protein
MVQDDADAMMSGPDSDGEDSDDPFSDTEDPDPTRGYYYKALDFNFIDHMSTRSYRKQLTKVRAALHK